MARLYGRSPRGERCRAAVPHGHWKTTTFTAGLRSDGLVAPLVLDGPMDGEAFLAYVEQLLAPSLRPGDTVIMDNLPAHKVHGVREAIQAVGACLLYLPRPCPISGKQSPTLSNVSHPMNVKIISSQLDTTQRDRKML
jgi:hypothetical protein